MLGASQFETPHLVEKERVDWEKVTLCFIWMNISESCRKPTRQSLYIFERAFTSKVPVKAFCKHAEGDVEENLEGADSCEIRKDIIDIGVIGIGENGHIALMIPADFETREALQNRGIGVNAAEQQLNEGLVPKHLMMSCSKPFH